MAGTGPERIFTNSNWAYTAGASSCRHPLIVVLLLIALAMPSSAIESITGRRAPCSNEGEEVAVDSIKDLRCFKCICQNGFIECEPENCPAVDDCYLLMKKAAGGCCDRCKECTYNGRIYASGTEWTDPDDPCATFKCVAGVVTESNLQCYTPCNNPDPPRPGQCCPTCLGCYLNGQSVLDGREVTLSEDPCLKCHCSGKRLTCIKKACPVLQCPISKQIRVPGECCPRCSERREIMQIPGKCILGKGFHSHGTTFHGDACSACKCVNGTSICHRSTCPVLECAPEMQKLSPGDCCPHCPAIAEVRSTCTYESFTYQNNDTWNLGPCRSCRCHAGEIRCAQTKCPRTKCRPNEKLYTAVGQCCAKCVEAAGVCTVFGDPHYKTFDGKFFSFQGSCKYQLTADCHDHTFSIRVTNDARLTKASSWTKTVTLKLGTVKVNLGQKMRVKVNGTRVAMPFAMGALLDIRKTDDGVRVDTELGVRLLWDGVSFLQVQVPASYKKKLCGLCGNYNNVWRDDLMTRHGQNMSESEIWRFANSWRVGAKKACARKNENLAKAPVCRQRKGWALCKPLRESEIFGECSSRLNPTHYFEACKKDTCECPPDTNCFCDSFGAYALECQRLGVQLPNWRRDTGCTPGAPRPQLTQLIEQMPRHRKRPHRPDYISHHMPKDFRLPKSPGRTPPPLT